MKKYLLLFVLFISSAAQAQEIISWDVGVFTGFSVHNQLLAVPLKNSFPAGLKIGAQWSEKWRMNFVYQFLLTEQDNGNSAQFHSVRLIPGYRFLSYNGHNIFAETGLGYQYATIQNVDNLRQLEIVVGPAWSWNFWKRVSFDGHFQYVHAFDSFIQTSLQQFQVTVGISYQFGNPQLYQAKYPSKDSDQDSVPDEFDACPSTVFGVKVANNGCPLDSDGDLIADYKDFCPSTKKTDEIDDVGCPLHILGRGVLETVAFENHSPRLTENSKNELSKIADILKKFPSLYYMIEGYASQLDSPVDQMDISKARAISVMNVLTYYGVPANKMTAVGLGTQFPLSTGSDWKMNERVEIKWQTQQ